LQVRRLRTVLLLWRDAARYRCGLRAAEALLQQMVSLRAMRASWSKWSSFAAACARLHRNAVRRTIGEALERWRHNALESRRERLLARCCGALEEHCRERLMAAAFGAWVEAWRVSRVWGLRNSRGLVRAPERGARGEKPSKTADAEALLHRIPTTPEDFKRLPSTGAADDGATDGDDLSLASELARFLRQHREREEGATAAPPPPEEARILAPVPANRLPAEPRRAQKRSLSSGRGGRKAGTASAATGGRRVAAAAVGGAGGNRRLPLSLRGHDAADAARRARRAPANRPASRP